MYVSGNWAAGNTDKKYTSPEENLLASTFGHMYVSVSWKASISKQVARLSNDLEATCSLNVNPPALTAHLLLMNSEDCRATRRYNSNILAGIQDKEQ